VSRYGFPSGHVAHTAALAGGLVLVAAAGRARAVAFVGGALVVAVVGFSRLAAGVHYPTDVLGAWLWVGAWLAVLAPWARPTAGGRPSGHAVGPTEEDA
jgi:undecaprenyl-diphosphatase